MSADDILTLRFRAECSEDVFKVFRKLGFNLRAGAFQASGPGPGPDMEVLIKLTSHTLESFKALVSSIEDAHVILQTVNPPELYTGNRWQSF